MGWVSLLFLWKDIYNTTIRELPYMLRTLIVLYTQHTVHSLCSTHNTPYKQSEFLTDFRQKFGSEKHKESISPPNHALNDTVRHERNYTQ
jgi:hypothetical protein